MIELALLLLASAIGFGISRWLKVPAIPLLIILGFLISLAAPGIIERNLLEHILEMGLAVLVFSAGIEMAPQRVGKQRKAALGIGIIQFIVLGLAGISASSLMGFNLTTSIYLGLALAASSTLVVVRLLIQRQQLFEPFGRLLIGVLLLQDIVIIVLIVYLAAWTQGGNALALSTLGLMALIAASFINLRWFIPWLVKRYQHEEEIFLLAILALLFTFIAITHLFNMPIVSGAFAAGISLSAFPSSGLIRGLFNSISDFFLAIFFTALGAIVVIPSLMDAARALAFIVIIIVLTPLVVILVAEKGKMTAKNAIESGILLAQTSEFSIIVALHGLVFAHISLEIFSIIILVTTTTMILTPFLSNRNIVDMVLSLHPSRASRPIIADNGLSDHFVIIGCGGTGFPLLQRMIVDYQYRVVVIDHDPLVVKDLHDKGIHAVWGDAEDPEALQAASAMHSHAIILLTHHTDHAHSIINHVGDKVPVLVHVFDDEQAQLIRDIGATPIVYTQTSVHHFMHWFRAEISQAPTSTGHI